MSSHYQSILIPFPRGDSRRQGAGCFRLLLKDLEATRPCRAPCLTNDNQDSHSGVVTSSTIDNAAVFSEGSGEADYEDGLADPTCGCNRRLAAWRRWWSFCCHRALTRQQGDVRAGVCCTTGRDPIRFAESARRRLSTDGVLRESVDEACGLQWTAGWIEGGNLNGWVEPEGGNGWVVPATGSLRPDRDLWRRERLCSQRPDRTGRARGAELVYPLRVRG